MKEYLRLIVGKAFERASERVKASFEKLSILVASEKIAFATNKAIETLDLSNADVCKNLFQLQQCAETRSYHQTWKAWEANIATLQEMHDVIKQVLPDIATTSSEEEAKLTEDNHDTDMAVRNMMGNLTGMVASFRPLRLGEVRLTLCAICVAGFRKKNMKPATNLMQKIEALAGPTE